MSKRKESSKMKADIEPADRSEDRHKPRNNIAISPRLHSLIKELAKKNRRPLNWEVEIAIENHLEKNLVDYKKQDSSEDGEEG